MTAAVLVWKCKCGEFQLKLYEYPFAEANCHCHSCVAAAKFIDGQQSKEEGNKGNTSAIDELHHGSCIADFYYEHVEFVGADNNPKEKLNYCKVGENGKTLRSYTKCCGTQCFNGSGKDLWFNVLPLNRNALYNADDGSKYVSPSSNPPVPNIQMRNAFDPSIVPEPKYKAAPFSFLFALLWSCGIQSSLGLKFGTLKDEPALNVDPDQVENVVPITWE